MGKAVKTDMEYREILEKSLSAIQYLRIHGFSTYMESEGIVNRIMIFKDKNELMREISNPISEKIEEIARESMSDLIENASEKKYRFRLDYMDDELTVDEFIRGRMKKVVDGGIGTMIESRAKSFVNELRKRYDMAFATFIVDNMRKQNMLKEDKIAELLKDNPNEK